MRRIDLKITALSPLSIGRQKPGGSVSEAETYIPGSVIRGAIASEILRHAELFYQDRLPQDRDFSQNGADFQTLFLDNGGAIFHNAYPATLKVDAQAYFSGNPIRVIPATAVSSKTKPGFVLEGGNGVFDTLIDRFCAELCDYPYDPNCPVDSGRVEPYSNFYSQDADGYHTHTATTRLLTRVGINRRRATSQDRLLYSLEVLNEVQGKNHQPAIYRSSVYVTDDLAESLIVFINTHNFRLGGAISRGLGRVEIKASLSLPITIETLEGGITQFNNELKDRWTKWQALLNITNSTEDDFAHRTYFTLDLQSDAILTEDWRRTTVISKEMLEEYTNIDNSSLKLHTAYSSYDYRSGWNAAWGLMKDVELVTNQGAVYLFSIDTNEKEKWIKALEELEIKGVGERTYEGFGQVIVCNEFHNVFREQLV